MVAFLEISYTNHFFESVYGFGAALKFLDVKLRRLAGPTHLNFYSLLKCLGGITCGVSKRFALNCLEIADCHQVLSPNIGPVGAEFGLLQLGLWATVFCFSWAIQKWKCCISL